jgi:hypothetical protein
MLAAGEDLVAYEILCHNLYEIGLRPPVDLTRELRQAAEGRTSGMRSVWGTSVRSWELPVDTAGAPTRPQRPWRATAGRAVDTDKS